MEKKVKEDFILHLGCYESWNLDTFTYGVKM